MSVMEFENSDQEWKEIWDASYLKAIAAFYNTDGGRMIVGRRDDGSCVGVVDPKDVAKKISDTVHNKLHIHVDVRIADLGDKSCVVIDVPAGNSIVPLDGRFYMRVGNTNQELEGAELKEAILKERGLSWLDQPCDLSIKGLSEEAVGFFVRSGKEHSRISESADEHDVSKVISSYDLWSGDKLSLTAGILFSPRPRILNEAAFLKIRLFDEKGVLRREDYVEEPLIMIPERAIGILYDRYIPDTYGYGGDTAKRTTMHQYPRKAVRELVVNAMVHKDYMVQEPTTIRVYPDRLEVFCFGGLPKGWKPEDLTKPHDSIRRNRALANVFYVAGYVENWGQGIHKVIDECRMNGNPDPMFSIRNGGLLVTIGVNPSKDVPPKKFDHLDVDAKDKAILDCISHESTVTMKEIAELTGIPFSTVRKRLKKMTESGMVERMGSTKSGEWRIID